MKTNKIVPIKNNGKLCHKCLKQHENITKLSISNRGYGSCFCFDGEDLDIQLCADCMRNEYTKWFEEQGDCDFIDNECCEIYKYEDNIVEFIESLPIQSREIIENSDCCSHIDAQDWIDLELGLVTDSDVYKRNNLEIPNTLKGNKDKLNELISKKWDDSYLRLLAIADHINECKMKYDAYKMASNNISMTKDNLKYELDKELMDLSILLDIEKIENTLSDNLYSERIDKFMSKLD